jgi:long-chain acyl-CoA synthetase
VGEFGFWNLAQADPAHLTLVDPEGAELSAGELLAECNRLVHGLRALGLKPGDTIATVLPNSAAMIQAYLAVMQAGWYLVPINYHLTAVEIAYILQDSGAKAFLCHARFGDAGAAAAKEADFPAEGLFAVGGDIEGFRPFESAKQGQPDSLPEDRATGDIMNYTAGTTGRPKGVRRPSSPVDPDTNAELNGFFLMLFGIMPRDNNVHLVVSPLYHTAVLRFASSSLHMGHTIVLMDRWTPQGTLELIDRYKVHDPLRRSVPDRRETADARLVGSRDLRVLRRDRGRRDPRHTRTVVEEAGHRRDAVADLADPSARRLERRGPGWDAGNRVDQDG